jgi:hypothetical protein
MTQLTNCNRIKFKASRRLFSLLFILLITVLSFTITACSPLQARTSQQRRFLDLSLEFLGEYQLPKMKFKETTVGGLSALTYDRQRNKFYALSDDRSQLAPARFYTLGLYFQNTDPEKIAIEKVEIEDVTFIQDDQGQPYPKGSLDPEGIALSPRETVFISSEGVPSQGITPFIREFDLQTGKQKQDLSIPEHYFRDEASQDGEPLGGMQDNLGFESLTLEPISLASASGDPFRLFTATESALFQDKLPADSEEQTRIRMMQYLIGNIARPMVVSEHLYLLDPTPTGAIDNGLTEVVTVDTGGHFLSLERTYGMLGSNAKIFQVATGAATDTSTIASLKGNISRVEPVRKKLLLNLGDLGIYIDNLEGMALGPRLPDGSQSLIVVSDDNFSEKQITQFLVFRLKGIK